jgi:hypothetical protein
MDQSASCKAYSRSANFVELNVLKNQPLCPVLIQMHTDPHPIPLRPILSSRLHSDLYLIKQYIEPYTLLYSQNFFFFFFFFFLLLLLLLLLPICYQFQFHILLLC